METQAVTRDQLPLKDSDGGRAPFNNDLIMKADELMVGDWVYMSENDIPRRITDIGRFDLISSYGISCYVDNIHPIPITPEILEKNGFTYCKSDGGFYLHTTISYGDWDVDVVLFDVTDEYRNNQLHISSPDDSYIAIHLMECNHVHELQHALRLCGIKKEISLC